MTTENGRRITPDCGGSPEADQRDPHWRACCSLLLRKETRVFGLRKKKKKKTKSTVADGSLEKVLGRWLFLIGQVEEMNRQWKTKWFFSRGV